MAHVGAYSQYTIVVGENNISADELAFLRELVSDTGSIGGATVHVASGDYANAPLKIETEPGLYIDPVDKANVTKGFFAALDAHRKAKASAVE